MKKRIIIGLALLIVSVILITTSKATFSINMDIIGGKKSIKVDEEVEIGITLNEKVVACNFDIIYNQDVFTLVESNTPNLSVAINGDKVSCIYFDMTQTGTDTLKVKFKALQETAEASNFSISNAKFREKGQTSSYTGTEIEGVDKEITISSVEAKEPEGPGTSSGTGAGEAGGEPEGPGTSEGTGEGEAGEEPEGPGTSAGTGEGETGGEPEEPGTSAGTGEGETGEEPEGPGTSEGTGEGETGGEEEPGTSEGTEDEEAGVEPEIPGILEKTGDKKAETPETSAGTENEEKQQITEEQDKTTIENKVLPKTGLKEQCGYLLMGCSILIILSAIFKYKENELKQIFKAGGLMLAITVVTINSLKATNVYAAEVTNPQIQIKFYNTLIENQKNVIIALNNKERTINKAQVLENNNNITDIVNTDKTSKEGTEIIKTGDIAKVGNDEYTIILYGDSNEDGTICDTDDVMTIVDDYLGKNKLNGINKIAANLENGDVLIDTDDIMKMIDAYIGTSNSIVSNIPAGELEIKTKTLAEIVQSGDYVDYPIQYDNVRTYYAPGAPEMHYGQIPSDKGWRVAYVDNGIVKLVTGGVPERIELGVGSSGRAKTITYLKTVSNFQKYIDSRYANTVIGALSVEEVENYDMGWLEEYNPDDDDADFSNGGVLTVLFDDDWLVYHRDRVSAGSGIEVGTRPVVTLKQNLTAVSGDGTEENPYVLEVIEE